VADPRELEDDVLARVSRWAAALREALPDLRNRLEATAAAIAASSDDFGREAAKHPAASWLQRRRMSRLSSTHLGCASPRDVVTLGAALGVVLPAEPV